MRRQSARGQTLIITALLSLALTCALMLTFVIGQRTREKIKLQSLADASAYSMAVSEARAMNFYAWSNRAIVSQKLSMISMHAFTSYLTWYEDMLQGAVRAFLKVEGQLRDGACCEGCPSATRNAAANRVRAIANYYYKAGRETITTDFINICSGGEPCVSNAESLNMARGADWFHEFWHAKEDLTNFCLMLVHGTRHHLGRIELIRAHQLNVEAELRFMMTGTTTATGTPFGGELIDTDDLDTKLRTPQERPIRRAAYETAPITGRALSDRIARATDPQVDGKNGANQLTRKLYDRAVSNGTLNKYGRNDLYEVLTASKYPTWLSTRSLPVGDVNWTRLKSRAMSPALQRPAGGPGPLYPPRGGDTFELNARNWGNARSLQTPPRDPARGDPEIGTPGDGYTSRPPDFLPSPGPPGTPNLSRFESNNTWFWKNRPGGGYWNMTGYWTSADTEMPELDGTDGVASFDMGQVALSYDVARGCNCQCGWTTEQYAGRNSIWADSHDWNWVTGDDVHSSHLFHGYSGRIRSHEVGDFGPLGQGLYRGHMRFKLPDTNVSDDENELWHQPQTYAVMGKPSGAFRLDNGTPAPWELDFRADLPSPVQFSTVNSSGDKVNGNAAGARLDMSAISSALTYYHQPNLSFGNGYQEPPNLWNPFWRAKLHPVRVRDAEEALTIDQPDSAAILSDPQLGPVLLNY